MVTLEDCRLIMEKYLNSEDFEITSYKEERNELTNNSLVSIQILRQNKNYEVRFLGIQFLSYPLSQNKSCPVESICEKVFSPRQNVEIYWTPTHILEKNKLIIEVDLPKHPYSVAEKLILDINHIKLVLETLAKYHAKLISFEELKSAELGKPYRLIQDHKLPLTYAPITEEPWFQARLNALYALFELLPQNELLVNKTFQEGLNTILKAKENEVSGSFRKTLCHSYIGGDSILFRYNDSIPVQCKLLNLGIPHYNSPVFDVLQFVYMVTTAEIRQEYFHELLDFYYDCFKTHISLENLEAEKFISFEEQFEIAVKYLLPLIKLHVACFQQIQCLPPNIRQKADLFSNPTQFVVQAFKTDENYRKLMTDSLLELNNVITYPEIMTEDCFQIIKTKIGTTKYKLLSYDLLPIENASGFFGDHRKLKIDISVSNQKQTIRLFVKFTPKGETQRSIANDCGSFYKEILFYKRFVHMNKMFQINVLDDCTVPCYFTRHEDVMIFEDFSVKNYGILNGRQPLCYDTVQLIIKQLAKFHASSIIVEEKISEESKLKFCLKEHYEKGLQESFFTKIPNHQGGKSFAMSIEVIEDQVRLFPDLKSTMWSEEFKIKFQKAYDTMYELAKPSTEFRNVICHGDLWISNILVSKIHERVVDCRFVDFQIMRYCPPAHDLLGFVYLTTDRNFRRQHMNDLIKLYHDELSTILKNNGFDIDRIYPFDKFMKSIEYMLPQTVCQTVIYYQICMSDPNLIKDYMTSEELIQQLFLEDRRGFIEEMCKKDPIYRERCRESLEDLKEMCLKYF